MNIRLFDIADVIRSKNSGPYELTFDIIFKELGWMHKVEAAGIFTPESFAALYGISPADVLSIIYFSPAKAVKITIRRPICSGGLGETDVYGAQQHGPLLYLTFELT